MDEHAARTFWIGAGGCLAILVAAALVSVRDTFSNADVALVLVVTVVVAAVGGGRAAGVVTAVVAALAFDFFHTKPYLLLTIDSRDDAVTTALLLVVGLIVGNLATSGRAAQSSAAASSGEIRRIHRVAELVARGGDAFDVIFAAQGELTELLHLERCRFEALPYPPPRDGAPRLERLERSGALMTRELRLSADGMELPEGGVELPVLGRGRLLGRFVLEPTPHSGVSLEQRIVAVAIADQVGAVLASPHPGEKGLSHA
jgi:hypothetical protein